MAMTELVPGISMMLVDGQPGLLGRGSLAFTEVLGPLRRLSDLVPGMRSCLDCLHVLHESASAPCEVDDYLARRLSLVARAHSTDLIFAAAIRSSPRLSTACALSIPPSTGAGRSAVFGLEIGGAPHLTRSFDVLCRFAASGS